MKKHCNRFYINRISKIILALQHPLPHSACMSTMSDGNFVSTGTAYLPPICSDWVWAGDAGVRWVFLVVCSFP